MSVENKKLREEAIRDGYSKLERLEPGSKEFGVLTESISRLEQSEREDYKVDEDAILRDRQLEIEEKKTKTTIWQKVLDVAKIVVPTGAYLLVTTVLIPKAEKDDYVPPQAKNLDPKRMRLWDK